MKHQEQLTKEFIALREAVRAFIHACPDFPEGLKLAEERTLANVESGISTAGN